MSNGRDKQQADEDRSWFDLTDVFYFTGLGLLGYGIHEALGRAEACVVVGLVLIYTAYKAY